MLNVKKKSRAYFIIIATTILFFSIAYFSSDNIKVRLNPTKEHSIVYESEKNRWSDYHLELPSKVLYAATTADNQCYYKTLNSKEDLINFYKSNGYEVNDGNIEFYVKDGDFNNKFTMREVIDNFLYFEIATIKQYIR